MLSASSPVTFPPSSPVKQPPPKRRIQGPFIFDDDDSESDAEESLDVAHKAKRRMLHAPGEKETSSDAKTDDKFWQTRSQKEKQSSRTEASTFPPPLTIWSNPAIFFPSYYKTITCSGQTISIKERPAAAAAAAPTYESMVAARSRTKEGRAKRSYYGIDIHELISQASAEAKQKEHSQGGSNSDEAMKTIVEVGKKPQRTLLWTEKYRARNFMDLCGDDGTNRLVLRWLKRWDPLVFSRAAKPLHSASRKSGNKFKAEEEKPHRKILLLTGPPGLGKTTLAHVCARQAGYEVMEINASDDRSRDVVKDRIRTSLGTQSVKTVSNASNNANVKTTQRSAAKPLCVIVDEVDGVTSGSGTSGEGGFVKALIDLIHVDEKNASVTTGQTEDGSRIKKKKKGDDFRQMRPLILICNDVYHPSLRPLRQSNLAEIIHVGRPSMEAVVSRLKAVFEKEAIPCEKDAVRKLCEAAWGMTGGADTKRGAESTVEGDLRGIMVVGEWVAGRFRSSSSCRQVMTRHWVETKVLQDVANGAGGGRGLGRGNVRDIVTRLFQEGAGFPKQALETSYESKIRQDENPRTEHGIGEQLKRQSTERLSQMINTSGEINSIVMDVFAEYPNRDFNDDCYLSKPNQAYDWLHFHDVCQSRLYSSQEWELAPYLCQPILACHHLFASPKRHHHHHLQPNDRFFFFSSSSSSSSDRRWPINEKDENEAFPTTTTTKITPFSGPRADYQAREAERHNRLQLQTLHAQLNPWLMRAFRSADDLAFGFVPYLARILSPDVKPVVVGGSQGSMASVRREVDKLKVKRASQVLAETGIALQKGKIENDGRGPQYVYRMDPDIDALSTFETSSSPPAPPTRFAIRQVLDQELQRTLSEREAASRQARFQAGGHHHHHHHHNSSLPLQPPPTSACARPTKPTVKKDFFGRVVVVVVEDEHGPTGNTLGPKVWVTFHEGLNNAVRKPISLDELLRGL